jgi:hypothetical protein
MDEPAGDGNLEIARRYLEALEQRETGAALRRFFLLPMSFWRNSPTG